MTAGPATVAELADLVRALAAGTGVLRPDPAPDGEEVSAEGAGGALDEVEAFVRRFVFFADEHHATVVTLWTAYTHLLAHLGEALPIAPRLGFISGSPGSGKTTAVDLLSKLAANGTPPGAMTPAVIMRKISNAKRDADERAALVGTVLPLRPGDSAEADEVPLGPSPAPAYPITLALDEIDRTYGPRADADDLTQLLNMGYRRGAVIERAHKDEQRETITYDVFAPVMFSGLALARLPAALVSRSFIVHMSKARPQDRPSSYYALKHDNAAEQLRDRLAYWAAQHAAMPPDEVRAVLLDERITAEAANRDHEIWSCLWLAAVFAAGSWPERLLASCRAMIHENRDRELTAGQRALAALRAEYARLTEGGRKAHASIFRRDAVDALMRHDERFLTYHAGRDEITPHGLAELLLKDFRIKSVNVSRGGRAEKGFGWAALRDAWTRDLPPVQPDEPDPDPADHAEE